MISKGTDWLRARVQRTKKLATGGIITAEQAKTVTLTVDNRESRFTPPGEPIPTGFIEINAVLSEAEVVQIRQRFQTIVTPQHTRSADKNCGCWPRYSNCGCKP